MSVKSAIKKTFIFLLGTISLLALIVIIFLLVLFFNPTLIVNPENINIALSKTTFLKSWSWKKGDIKHEWIKWNHRKFSGNFIDLCFVYENKTKRVDTCLNEIRWNVELTWKLTEGFKYLVYDPLFIDSRKLVITTLAEDNSPPPDYLLLWNLLWEKVIPDLNFNFRSIDLVKPDSRKHFDLRIIKNDQVMKAFVLDFEIFATKNYITIHAPKSIKLPVDLKTKKPLFFKELKLTADLKGNNIPLVLTGKIESASLSIHSSFEKKWLKNQLSSQKIIQNILLKTEGELVVLKINRTLKRLMKPPFNELPAPVNAMEGSLRIELKTEKIEKSDEVLFKLRTEIDMQGARQVLKFNITSDFPFGVPKFSIGSILLGLEFEKVELILPQLEKNKMPPQFKPDPRFIRPLQKKKGFPKKIGKKKPVDLKMRLQATSETPLQIRTNLLDEILRLYFDLNIEEGVVKNGYIQTLPFKTTVFRRKLNVTSVRFKFHAPIESEVEATIDFLLPDYLITLKLEGPLSKPRTAFSSKPPLPQDDIIAVLLFGRPLNDLNADDRNATKETSQVISQGLLSLSVLYFFAGSPIQSLGYDPDTKQISAQVGLGRKNTLRVSRESRRGISTAGVRHSLGKGWYIDSTVQKSSGDGTRGNDYGVLLERIISY